MAHVQHEVMPCIAPSHQAPALLLKRWHPTLFSGFALVLGTLAPDLEFILRIQSDWVVSHTVAAQLYFTAPLTVLLYWLSVDLVLPWLVPFLPAGAPFCLEGLAGLGRPRRAPWGSVAVSGAVGGLTHIFLDGFTHGGQSGWAVAFLPFLRSPIPGLKLPLHDGLQTALSLGLGLYALDLWRQRVTAGVLSDTVPNPRSGEARATFAAAILVAAAFGVAFARHLHPTAAGIEALALEAYGAVDATALALVVGATWDRVRAAATSSPVLFDGA